MKFSFVIFVLFLFVSFLSFLFKMCTVGLYVSLCLMIFLCPFFHCKALRTAMYKRYINSIIIIIIITEMDSMIVHIINNFRIPVRAKNTCKRFLVTTCIDPSTRDKLDRPVDRSFK